GEREFTVTDLVQETEDTTSVMLAPADETEALPSYRPGHHVTVRMNTNAEDIARSYSLSHAASTNDQARYRITVRHTRDDSSSDSLVAGTRSTHIAHQLRHGDHAYLTAPDGNFAIPTELDLPIVLIAGGIGITPFMGYLETLAALGSSPEVLLLYSNRNG